MTARKNSNYEGTNGNTSPEVPATEKPASEAATDPKKRVAAGKSSSRKRTASVKAAVKGEARKSGAKPRARTRARQPYEPSDADIRLRAYFIAERRVQMALQGNPARDWIEARQQLLQEASHQNGS